MLLRSKPYDHILQSSTITCRHNNKLHNLTRMFPLYPQLTLIFELTSIQTFCPSPKHVLTLIFLNSEAQNLCRICIPASSGDPTPISTVTHLHTFPACIPLLNLSHLAPPVLMQHFRSTLAFKPLILFLPTLHLLPLHPYHHLMTLTVFLYFLLPLLLFDSLRVLQWSAEDLRVSSTELLHFISSHPVDLIYIYESNLNLSSLFRILRFSALRFDCTHSWSGIFSTDVTHASGGVIIFVRQRLSFSELSTSSLSSLHPYSDYVEVNISLNDSSLLSFLNVCAPLFALIQRIAKSIPFLPPFFPTPKISSF